MRMAKAVTLTTVGAASLAAIGFSVPSALASTSFVPGTATGIAQALQVAPRTGGFAYTMSVGNAIAQYRGSLAQAETQLLDLGLIGTSLTAEGCDGSKPTIDPSDVPQPLIVESDQGNKSASHDYAGNSQGGLMAAGGHESVTATTVPSSQATFQGGVVGAPGFFEASGMTTSSTAQLISGKARIATADASVGRLSLLNDAVVLHNLHWTATVRTGSNPARSGTFTMGDATVAGQTIPVTPSTAGTVLDSINKAIAQTGLHLTLPQPSKTADGGIAIPPLSVGIDDSQTGGSLLNPIDTATQPVQQQLAQALLSFSCKTGTLLLLKDIGLGTVDGTGGFDLKFGGVSAGTTAIAFTNPFGSAQFGSAAGSLNGPSGTAANPRTTTTGAVPRGTGPVGGVPASQPQLAGKANVVASCATTSPAHWPSCSNGAALAAGLLGLAAVLGVGGADFVVSRRRRRLPQLDL